MIEGSHSQGRPHNSDSIAVVVRVDATWHDKLARNKVLDCCPCHMVSWYTIFEAYAAQRFQLCSYPMESFFPVRLFHLFYRSNNVTIVIAEGMNSYTRQYEFLYV